MSLYLSSSTPQQPAFLYASYSPAAAAAASSTAAGYSASHLLDADEANGWKPASTATATLIIDLGEEVLHDTFAVAGKRLKGVSVVVSTSPDNVTYTEAAETTLQDDAANWINFSPTSFRFLLITLSEHTTAMQMKHVVSCLLVRLPFLEDGYCPAPLESEGEHLISATGLYLGSTTQKVTRSFDLDFGQVTPAEESAFASWANACILSAQGFFWVPDTALAGCFFGYCEKKYRYEPSMRNGLYSIPKIPFRARAA